MKMDRRVWLQKHILAMVYVMGILFGVMVLRYAWLQLVAGDELSERMRSQVGYDLAIQSPRGTITDRNGREMAVSLMTKSLYIDPNHVSDPDALASDLAPLINMPEQEILDDISAGGGFVWVKRHMEHDEYEAVRKMVREKSYTDCVGFRDEAKRYYPNDILGANVLGFVGTDDKGLDGIEQGLDGLLKGEVKEKYLTTDRQNRPILDSIFSSQRQYKGEYCKNVMVSGRRIQNWSGTSFGTVTFTDVVKQSLNTGFAQVGLRLGAQKLTDYAKLFGFGMPTGIELPGEEGGLLFNPDDMRDSDVATMAIGQSIAVTPLQLVTAMSAIANDGVLLKPHIVKTITNVDGSIYEEKGTTEVRRTIESATDKTLVGLLEQVVASGGGKKAAVKGYRIAGKTGTAQKIRPDGSGYMEGHYIASFCGFAPVEDPQLTVLVMIDDPGTGNYYGGQIAAPVASRIFTQLFRYLHIEPSSDPFAGMESKAKPSAKTQKSYSGTVPDGKVVVPDFSGKSMREAAQLAADRGLNCDPDGSGYAVSQSIAPNTLVDKGTTVTVQFKSQ